MMHIIRAWHVTRRDFRGDGRRRRVMRDLVRRSAAIAAGSVPPRTEYARGGASRRDASRQLDVACDGRTIIGQARDTRGASAKLALSQDQTQSREPQPTFVSPNWTERPPSARLDLREPGKDWHQTAWTAEKLEIEARFAPASMARSLGSGGRVKRRGKVIAPA